jgi:hypothetical protein
MPDGLSLLPALKRAVRTSIRQVQGSKQRDVALVWRGTSRRFERPRFYPTTSMPPLRICCQICQMTR